MQGGGAQLAAQLIGALAMTFWPLVLITPLFVILKLVGWLRVSEMDETLGAA